MQSEGAWIPKIVAKLKNYIDSSRIYEVRVHGNKVYGMDDPEHVPEGYLPGFYLSENGCESGDPLPLEDYSPSDFTVFRLEPKDEWWN